MTLLHDPPVLRDTALTVAETETHLIELVPMIFNWRLVLTPKAFPESYDAGWCYFGTGPETFARAYLAAAGFDPDTHTDPIGYDKALQRRTLDG